MNRKIYKRKSGARMVIVSVLAAQALFFSGVSQAQADKHAAHRKAMQAEPIADDRIDVLYAGDTVPHEAIGFAKHRALQPVEDEALRLAMNVDRPQAGIPV